MQQQKQFSSYFIIPAITLFGLTLGIIFHFIGREHWDDKIWLVTMAFGTLPLVYRILKDVMRGHFGIDIIAITAIVTAFILNEHLAGTVIVLMLSGGEALEAYAIRRARKELSALISNAPSVAHLNKNGTIIDVNAAEVKVGDELIIKPGEIVPVDGIVINGISELDESALTGESVPVGKKLGSHVLSGSVNKDNVLEIKTVRQASESKYEQIIKLVKEAEESRAPVVRLADRYSVWFSAVTFALAGLAWFLAGDPNRLLAVLVVATPCPLILATPIAMISGISKSASRGIIIKSGQALETLAETNAFIFDKTGTLTLGKPEISQIIGNKATQAEVLRLAASLDQFSAHILARSLSDYARAKNLPLTLPEKFTENFGEGVAGEIGGKRYLFGKLKFLQKNGIALPPEIQDSHIMLQEQGKIPVYLGSEGQLYGSVIFADVIRPEMKNLFADFKKQGLDKLVMLTGDKKSVAETIARQLGLDDIHAEALPDQKVAEVLDHKKQFGKVAMVGDGINDAPALAAADVGIALGSHGSTATADTSDIVITVDNLERVGEAYGIARHVLKIAKQGIFIGIGVSILLMIFASLGFIKPLYGALLQELLDVAVILNALRVNFQKVE